MFPFTVAGVSSTRPRPGQPLRVVQQYDGPASGPPSPASPGTSPPSPPPAAPPSPTAGAAGTAGLTASRTAAGTTGRVPSRSPIEALARKLRAIPVRSVRSVRWHSSTANSGNGSAVGAAAATATALGGSDHAGDGLRSDHSAISNSSLQEWDQGEQGGAELLTELVQYMGELNQLHAAYL